MNVCRSPEDSKMAQECRAPCAVFLFVYLYLSLLAATPLISWCTDTAGSLAVTTSLSPIIPTLIQYYGAIGIPGHPSPQTVLDLGTYPTLFGGIGAIITITLARWFGTRPVLVVDSILLFCATAWSAVSKGKDRGLYSNLAARCFIGLGGGAYESLVPLIIQDITFIHERNRAIALVLGSGGLAGATFGGVSTFIATSLDWRWLYWIINIINGAAMVLIFFFVPETTWPRRMADLSKCHTLRLSDSRLSPFFAPSPWILLKKTLILIL